MLKNIKISSFKFTIIFSLFHCIILNFFVLKKIFFAINIESASDIYFFCVLTLGLNLLYFTTFQIFFISKYLTKFCAIFFTIASSFASYFTSTYNIIIDRGMLENAMMTDLNETLGLLSVWMFIYLFATLVAPLFFILKTKINHAKITKKITIFAISFCISVALILPNYVQIASFFRKNHSLGGQAVPSNYISASITYIKKKIKEKNIYTEVDLDAKISKQNDVLVIMVVGETARRANFSLYGYGRQTNPRLEKIQIEKVQNATSCGTSTNVSVPCIFSPQSRVNFVNKSQEFLTDTLVRLNLKPNWIENNFGGCYDVCDKSNYVRFDGKPDGIMLSEFDKMIAKVKTEKNQQLIVLHQNGSHGPLYKDRFEDGFDKFQPMCKTSDVAKCSKDELVNTYDNTILYTDYFLSKIIEKIEKISKPTILIYASDHGESLGEHGLFLHGFPYSIAPKEQKEIPFLIYTSKSFRKKHKPIKSCIESVKTPSHDNIYHTIAGLMKLETKFYNKDLDMLKNCTND